MNWDTDSEWERWGQHEPYFGVITHPRFRRAVFDEQARAEFFGSGQAHVDYVLQMIRTHIDPEFAPRSVLDFGCGVGRTLVPFARSAESVTGLDVSRAMLVEARKNCVEAGVENVHFAISDDALTQAADGYDLVHSYIVFQHIEPRRGKEIFGRLVRKITPGGVGALHILYSKNRYSSALGIASDQPSPASSYNGAPSPEPEMQMNAWGATEVLFILQALGASRVHLEFTDHGGELGLFLFFKVPE